MAARRHYAYYIRGRKLALIEHDNVSGSGQTLGQPSLDDIGPSGALSWKSPIATIADGLEIEYAYSPRYSLVDPSEDREGSTIGRTKLISSGWFIDGDGFLCFLTNSETLTSDVQSTVSNPWGSMLISNEEYILIQNSSRWNGPHKIQGQGGSEGWIQTYTKASSFYGTTIFSETAADVNIDSSLYLSADAASDVWVNLIVAVGDHVWLTHTNAGDTGLYKVTAVTEVDGGTEAQQLVTLGTKYFINPEDDLDEFQTGDSHLTAETALFAYKVKYDPCYVIGGIDVMDDESDTIDLPEYLAKALVYYVKAKISEDQMDLEGKEYYMREFRRILEKHESSKIWGSRVMIPGSSAIR